MTRPVRIVKGLAALALLAAVVIVIPWALWHFVGWPLPHHAPSASQISRALNRQGIPDQTLVDALAVVVWITWATLVVSIAVEIAAALKGRHASRLPLAGIFQPVTGRLVATVIVACLSLAPRPAHPSSPGSSGHNPSAGTAPRPVAAFVLKGAVLTDATEPLAATPAPATSTPAAANSAPPSPPTGQPSVYVVQRGDTLWGIAEHQLGDPLRWSEIYQLNQDRPQPGGVTLTDPHWIDPGWTLLLPAPPTPPGTATPSSPATPAAPAPSSPVTPPAPAPSTHQTAPVPAPPGRTVPATTTPTTTIAPAPKLTAPAPATTKGTATQRSTPGGPVRLPSGSVVAGSFAAGVVSAVALGRLRKRHNYRYRPPKPGRDLTPEPSRPTLQHLTLAAQPPKSSDPDPDGGQLLPGAPLDRDERIQQPGLLEIATRDGEPVTIEMTDLSGAALSGPAVDPVVRALLASLMVRAGRGAAEVLLPAELADRLLPDLAPNPAVRRVATSDEAARAIEAERIARTRLLMSVDAPDAHRFRHDNPENPLPALLVHLDSVPDESLGRWAALLADAPRLGIAVLFLTDTPIATGRLSVDANRTVISAEPTPLSQSLSGAQLYGLQADEAVELLDSVNEANSEPDTGEDLIVDTPPISVHQNDRPGEPPEPAPIAGEPWPQTAAKHDQPERPLVVNVLGPYRITALGEPVTTGLRSRAKVLLAWSLLRPEGATIEQFVDALWPDTPPDRVLKQFWHALGDLRTFFRGPAGETLDVLEKIGEHYQPSPAEIGCDLWEFQSALSDAAQATDDKQARTALRRAVDAYGGDLLAGTDYPWVEPVRQDLHRRALDAYLRLAELEAHTGHPESAVDTLENVIELDRYAEEPYRRLMALHAAHGRLDAVTATWKLLQRRLADLDVEVDQSTARLYRTLTAPEPDISRQRPIRLSS